MTDRCAATLRAWRAPTHDQAELRVAFLDHLASRDDGWSRACPGAHLTASTLVCDPVGRRVLLTLHRRLGRWLQTGGHLEPADADLEAAALREAREESGLGGLSLDPAPLRLSRHEVPCGPWRPTYHLDVQYLVRSPPTPPLVSEESVDVRWFDHDELPEVDASVHELVAAAAVRLDW